MAKLSLLLELLFALEQGECQYSFCYKQIDSIVNNIVLKKSIVVDSGNLVPLNSYFYEQIIVDSINGTFLAIMQNYRFNLITEDTAARTYCIAYFFDKEALIKVAEFEGTVGLKKTNIHNYYYAGTNCTDNVFSDPDMTKKAYYFMLANKLKQYYSKHLQ